MWDGIKNAQRRPGLSPRRHVTPEQEAIGDDGAQRRPGLSPRRHVGGGVPAVQRERRSTKAGAFTPATLQRLREGREATGPLNEGRGFHPGDTRLIKSTLAGMGRSTKAGAFTPATPAQRVPAPAQLAPLNEGRGFHPGDTRTAARSCRRPTALNEGRGFHPGDTRHGRRTECRGPALNEGRGFHPGDTMILGRTSPRRSWSRSTKAGAFTPATPEPVAVLDGYDCAQRRPGLSPRTTRAGARNLPRGPVRSTKAGAFTPATHRPGLAVHGVEHRSTKAGAFTPATPPSGWTRTIRGTPLNEGRGFHPGDTRRCLSSSKADVVAQRRPGLSPRRHVSSAGSSGPSSGTLNEGRGFHPGDT